MAIDTRSDLTVATQLLQQGWAHSFVPYGVDLTERLSWLVDIYGEPRGTELFFNHYNIPDTGDWLLIRLDPKFKQAMDMAEEYLLLFCSEEMRMAYTLRFPR